MIYIDYGHGGLIGNTYQTKGKQAKHPNFTFYEGVFNREVAVLLMAECLKAGIPFVDIVANTNAIAITNADVSLSQRLAHLRAHYTKHKPAKCVLFSIHGNAANGLARGWECWTTVGQNRSDKYASKLYREVEALSDVYDFPMRPGGKREANLGKEENFTIISGASSIGVPAVLSENLFFDNLTDAQIMLDKEFQKDIAIAHLNAYLNTVLV